MRHKPRGGERGRDGDGMPSTMVRFVVGENVVESETGSIEPSPFRGEGGGGSGVRSDRSCVDAQVRG
jgi:hypothetical protein